MINISERSPAVIWLDKNKEKWTLKKKKVTGPYQDKLHPVPKVQFFDKISKIAAETTIVE